MLKTLLRVLILLWGILILCLSLAAFAPESPVLIYVVSAEANSDIFAYDIYWHLRVNLSNSPFPEWRGTWSETGLFAFTATPNQRDSDALYLSQDFSPPQRLESLRNSLIFGASLSPNGKYLLYITSEPANYSEIYRVDLETEELLNLSNTPNLSEAEPQWVGNEALLFLRGGNLYHQAMNTEPSLMIDASFAIEDIAISPDLAYVAFHGIEWGERYLYIAQGNAFAQIGLPQSLSSEALSWSPDSQALSFTLADGSLAIYHLTSQNLSQYSSEARRSNPLWSPEGLYIAFMENRRIHLLDWRSGEILLLDEERQIRPPLLWIP